MKILVINAGSSSLKYKLFIGRKLQEDASGIIDRIGLPFSKAKTHQEAIELVFKKIPQEIDAIGHRVVHGGEKHIQPALITPSLLKDIKKLSTLAPLHNPANLAGIRACRKLLPKIPQVAIFDTAFHSTIPEKTYRYALPEKFQKKHAIRRYGFHGTSHRYVTDQARKLLRKPGAKIITCHIGNGSSITASQAGKSLDTSMGFTPLEGIAMGTRSGSIDPGIIFHLQNKLRMSAQKVEELLQNQSGLKALSGNSSDMRKIWARAQKGNKKALLTIEVLSYSIAKYIGAYTATLNGVDAIVFTGGMGQRAHYVRKQTCDYFKFLGLKLDPHKNEADAETISTPRSKVKVFVIPTNEELQIAQETLKTIS